MSPLTADRREALERDVLNDKVSGIAIQASEMADLLLRARVLDDLSCWAKRAICWIGEAALGDDHQEGADDLIADATTILAGNAHRSSREEK